jgi:hypothetical protein
MEAMKRDLAALRSALSAGDYTAANRAADRLRNEADTAHGLTTGPAWWVASNLPWAGEPLRTQRVLAAAGDSLASRAIPGVLELAKNLDGSTVRKGDSIDLDVLRRAAPVLARAVDSTRGAIAAVQGTASGTWLGPADAARRAVIDSLEAIAGQLDGASNTVDTALPMLGGNGLRRYFVGFMNEAEARGLGGLPGGFAIVTADKGKITFDHFGNDTELDGVKADVNLGADFDNRYGPLDPTGTFVNSDVSPHFPYAAQIWASMWQKKTGQHIDGAIAVDPTALSYLLKVTGPTRLADGTTVDSGSVIALLQQGQYARYADDADRDKFVLAIADAVADKVTSGNGPPKDLVRMLGKAARERRLVMWSTRPAEQNALVAAGYAGVIGGNGRPLSGFTVTNAAGSKLDYYLDRSMSYTRKSCDAGSPVTATLTLTNRAPTRGLPAYVVARADKPDHAVMPGDNRMQVSYYATPGATIKALTLDGKAIPFASVTEAGNVVVSLMVELPVGSTRTIEVRLRDPEAGPVQLLRQPLVRAQTESVDAPSCS